MAWMVGLLLGFCLLAWTPASRAGEWTQVTCTQPNGQPAPIEGWDPEAVSGGGDYSNAYSTCEQAGGALIAESSNQWPQSRYSGYLWHYAAPNGSTIAGGTLSLNLYSPEGQAYIATPANSYPSDVVMNCQFNLPCSENGLNGGPFVGTVPIDRLGGTNLYAEAECLGPGQPGEPTESCPTNGGGNSVNAQTAIYAADIELQNSSTPAGTDFAGSLLAPNTSGTADLTFNAKDPEGPGVYRVIVDVDGSAVYQGTPESNGGRCASIGEYASGVSEFLYAQPCKQEMAVDVPVDTTKLTNGSHQLKVTVQDAAGNSSTVYAGTISIANPGSPTGTPIGPGSPLAERGAPNGTNASDQAKLTARWTSTSKTTRTSDYGQADRVTGRLTTTAGQPISGALLDVSGTLHGTPIPPGGKQLVLEASSGGEWIQFNTITTTAKGHYRASYRFKFPGPVTYRFRVISRYEADFPFLAGASNIVDVHER
jgi:hypothetical protein